MSSHYQDSPGYHRHKCCFCGFVWEHSDNLDNDHGDSGAHECFNCGRCNWGMGIYDGEEAHPTRSREMAEIKNVFVPIRSKSLLEEIRDHLVTVETPKPENVHLTLLNRNLKMEIVGHCPLCGSPVYGQKTISSSSKNPEVVRSCKCGERKSFQDTIQTK